MEIFYNAVNQIWYQEKDNFDKEVENKLLAYFLLIDISNKEINQEILKMIVQKKKEDSNENNEDEK